MAAASVLGEARVVAPGTSLADVPTPALIVDLDRLERNLVAMAELVGRSGRRLRPHAKAHKSIAIMRRQLAAGAAGVAVAKTGEAEVMVAGGCRDVVVAYPVVGEEKWRRLAALADRARVGVNVESEAAARGLSAAAAAAGVTLRAQLEVDTGLERTGIPASDVDALVALGRTVVELPGLELAGVTTYRGLSFAGAGGLGRERSGYEEAEAIAAAAAALRQAGLAVAEVAAGSTATAAAVATADGITEVRAGAYLFGDGAQIAAGSAGEDDVALTVLATVVGATRRGFAVIDAGSKTFGAAGPPATAGAALAAVDGRGDVVRLNEEHGIVRLAPGRGAAVGDRLQFIPHHASAAVNLADELVGVRAGVIEERFAVDARGCRT